MKAVILNNELNFAYPDDFEVLSEDEIKEMNFIEKGEGICIRNKDKRILVSIGYKKVNGFASFILNDKDIIKKNEKIVSDAMKVNDYQLDDFLSRNVAGQLCQGFSYDYLVNDIKMHGETVLLKLKNNLYYINSYVRDENKEKTLSIIEDMYNNSKII